jgi:transposase-like protein
MRELSVAEQRYPAVLAVISDGVISDGLSISQVASKVGVSRQTLHTWLARYGAQGLEGPGAPTIARMPSISCMHPACGLYG